MNFVAAKDFKTVNQKFKVGDAVPDAVEEKWYVGEFVVSDEAAPVAAPIVKTPAPRTSFANI